MFVVQAQNDHFQENLAIKEKEIESLKDRITVLEDCMDDICEKEDETKGAKRKNLINYL